jgi:hypothetical protein
MSIEQWAGFIVSAITIAVAFVGSVRWPSIKNNSVK